MTVHKKARNGVSKVLHRKISLMVNLASVAIIATLLGRCLMMTPPSRTTTVVPNSSTKPIMKDANEELDFLEKKILQALADRGDSITPVAEKPMDDYRATRFQLSPGRPLYARIEDFDFMPYQEWLDSKQQFKPSLSASSFATENSKASVKRLVCHIDRGYKNLLLWQHYIHMVAPCWSLFQLYPDAEHYIDLDVRKRPENWESWTNPGDKHKTVWASWILKLNEYYFKEGVNFIDLNPLNISKDHYADHSGDWVASTQQKMIDNGHGYGDPTGEGPYLNAYYFMSPEDIYKLQRSVLGSELFQSGPAMGETIRLLILNREGGGVREWRYANEAHQLIQKHNWSSTSSHDDSVMIDAKLLPSFDGYSFEEQANEIHSADIIISPHGAQLTNLLFARPCTVVLELYPRGFYLPKKVPLLVEAGGIGFVGYHFDGSHVAETPKFVPDNERNGKLRRSKRDVRFIYASPSSILYALPDLLHAAVTCRKQHLLVSQESAQGNVSIQQE